MWRGALESVVFLKFTKCCEALWLFLFSNNILEKLDGMAIIGLRMSIVWFVTISVRRLNWNNHATFNTLNLPNYLALICLSEQNFSQSENHFYWTMLFRWRCSCVHCPASCLNFAPRYSSICFNHSKVFKSVQSGLFPTT